MIDQIIHWDIKLFLFIQENIRNPLMDAFVPLLRNRFTWIPLYFFLFYWLWSRFGSKSIRVLLLTSILIFVSDQSSSSLIKPTVKRNRPCNNTEISSKFKPLIPCGSGYSFTSSHATNHFALAMFIGLILYKKNRGFLFGLMVWAGLVACSQVYVGVHYPLDVIAGAMLGVVLGGIFGIIALKVFKFATWIDSSTP